MNIKVTAFTGSKKFYYTGIQAYHFCLALALAKLSPDDFCFQNSEDPPLLVLTCTYFPTKTTWGQHFYSDKC